MSVEVDTLELEVFEVSPPILSRTRTEVVTRGHTCRKFRPCLARRRSLRSVIAFGSVIRLLSGYPITRFRHFAFPLTLQVDREKDPSSIMSLEARFLFPRSDANHFYSQSI